MTVSFSSNVLLSYLEAKAGLTDTSGGSANSARTQTPTAPWNAVSTTSGGSTAATTTGATALSTASSLAQSILVNGTQLIDPSAATLSVSTNNPTANSDYENLFALYKGLTSLKSLASAASSNGIADSQLTQLQKAFANGLGQVQSFITSNPFKEFQVGDGAVSSSDETTTGVPEENDTYTTGLTASSTTAALPQLQGDVQFSLNVTSFSGAVKTVNFNLADLGSTPRSLGAVVTYLNSQLAAAGVKTRFADQLVSPGTTAAAATTSTPATSTTLPQIALTIQGSALETLSFQGAGGGASVDVAQTSTEPVLIDPTASTSTSGTSSTAVTASQVLALDPTGQHAVAVGSKLWTDNLPSDASVQATATGPDGSVYVLANVTGAINGQSIQGSQDATLLKYDSAGTLVYTRTLGSATSASGDTLAISPDGTQVAIAGSVTGTLDPTDTAGATSTTTQSFVTTYDTSAGDELWTQTQDADDDNQATSVAFGSDNTVYVAGSVQGTLRPGAISTVTQQAYLQTYSAQSVTDPVTQETSWTAAPTSTIQYGATGINRATGVAVSNGTVYVSGVENGDAVVRAYDATTPTRPVLSATQDLGAVQGGGLNGIAVGADGSVYVAGSTHNAALNAGTITSAYSGNGDAFVAKLSPTLNAANGESVAYLNNGNVTTGTALAVGSGGEVYVTGQTATGSSPDGAAISELGYAAEIDPTTGQVAWNQALKGSEGNAAPTSIAVDATGSSSLAALGLPTGSIAYTGSTNLVSNTALRVGDQFAIQAGGVASKVTIEADDTYSTLAQKIELASGFRVTATTTTDGKGNQQLEIKPANKSTTSEVAIESGPIGRDALTALGLSAGLITNASLYTASTVTTPVNAATNSLKAAYKIQAPTTLNLNSSSSITAAIQQLDTAITEVQTIYQNLATPTSTAASGSRSSASNAGLIKFYNSQAANYATALSRLTGS